MKQAKRTLFNTLFIRKATFLILFLTMLGCSGAGMAEFEEGKHYFKVENAKPGTGDTIKVIEFFNYACPHCNNLEPHLQNWLKTNKADYIDFEHMPAFWNVLFENSAKALYTAEALNVEETMHQALFDAIHQKRMNFNDVQVIEKVFVDQGVSAEDFQKQYNSFFVNQKINIANKLFANYKLRSVPSFVIDGQWRTSVQDAGSHDALFKIINYLAKKSKNNR